MCPVQEAHERAPVLLLDLHRKSRTDRDRAQTLDTHTDFFFSPSCCAPHLPPGRNRIFQSVATRGCTRDTVHGGAVATGVPPPLMDDGCSLCTVGPRRVGRRCLSPPGTASPHAVPQICGRPNPRPAKPLVQFLKQQEKFTWGSALTRISCFMRARINRDGRPNRSRISSEEVQETILRASFRSMKGCNGSLGEGRKSKCA